MIVDKTITCEFIEHVSMLTEIASTSLTQVLMKAADINHDDRLDLIYFLMSATIIGIFTGNDNSSLHLHEHYVNDRFDLLNSLHLIDWNDDDNIDILYSFNFESDIKIRYGDGNGSFSSQINLLLTDRFSSVIDFGHLNNDTYLDLIIGDFVGNHLNVCLSDRNGIVIKTPAQIIRSVHRVEHVSLLDMNNDAILDVVWLNSLGNIGIALGIGNGTFHPQHIQSIPEISLLIMFARGDFNGDGALDLVTVGATQNEIRILLNNGNETFRPLEMTFGRYVKHIQSGDFNHDHHIDIVVASHSVDEFNISYGLGNGNFSEPMILLANRRLSISGFTVGDFNNDEYLDIVVTDYQKNQLIVLMNFCRHDENKNDLSK